MQSSIRLYGLTQGREILCLAQAGLHTVHKTRGKSACTLSIPWEFATSSFKSFEINCSSRHFSRTTMHLCDTLYWNIAHLDPLLELPVDCLPDPCSAQIWRTVTLQQPFEQLLGPIAALSRSELLESLLHLPFPLYVEWEGQALYMLYGSGVKHGLVSTWAEF